VGSEGGHPKKSAGNGKSNTEDKVEKEPVEDGTDLEFY